MVHWLVLVTRGSSLLCFYTLNFVIILIFNCRIYIDSDLRLLDFFIVVFIVNPESERFALLESPSHTSLNNRKKKKNDDIKMMALSPSE